jgi:F-type H+-transporting ATPase subunit gamma
MATMREIRSRINATKKTSQITKAMHMVSASKLKKAEKSITGFRPLMKRLRLMIDNVLETDDELHHPMLTTRDVRKTCYIIVSSDRGLAGPYNSSIFKAFKAHVEEHHNNPEEYVVAPIGYKAMSFVKNNQYPLLQDESIHVRDDVQFIDFQSVTEHFMRLYIRGEIDRIVVFYNHFINTITQEVNQQQLLPIINGVEKEVEEEMPSIKLIYNYEPNPRAIINHLVPLYVENMLYGIILDAKASEHAARMTAMKSATDNAEDLIKTLQLHYNRARQAAITIELTDIIGGANAVN